MIDHIVCAKLCYYCSTQPIASPKFWNSCIFTCKILVFHCEVNKKSLLLMYTCTQTQQQSTYNNTNTQTQTHNQTSQLGTITQTQHKRSPDKHTNTQALSLARNTLFCPVLYSKHYNEFSHWILVCNALSLIFL